VAWADVGIVVVFKEPERDEFLSRFQRENYIYAFFELIQRFRDSPRVLPGFAMGDGGHPELSVDFSGDPAQLLHVLLCCLLESESF